MSIRREIERGFTALGKEFGAYRSIVDASLVACDSAFGRKRGPLLGRLFDAISRLFSRPVSEFAGL